MNARTEFPLDAVEPPALRRAALALHATGAADRAWLLAQLPAAHRAALETMLSELAALGVPPDRQLTQRLLAQPVRVPPPVAVVAEQDARQGHRWLASVRARDLAAVLQEEPAALVAHVLRLLPAPQREAVLALLMGPLLRQVNEALRTSDDADASAAPRLTRLLLEQLPARLPRPASATPWQRFARRLPWHARRKAAA